MQHDLSRAWRPAPLTLDSLQPLEEAAHVEQQSGELRPDGVKRAAQLLARRNHHIREGAGAALSAPAVRKRCIPARRDARRHVCAGEIATQPLTGLQLHALDQRLSVPPLAPGEPRKWAFGLVDRDLRMTV